eukprot:TRINITY_DN445_c0_g1_i6.p2 TRINITY_DN445_c0_g1~~TRINITY_DN445_c0_g1_i6.p2  ORF type:complete len:827 (+),score=369.94 TRINITY_DN445_c0_g1_i6:107-2482(+)
MDGIEVVKRSGRRAPLEASKLRTRVDRLTQGLDLRFIDVEQIVNTVLNGSHTGMTTEKLDELLAQTVAYMTTKHPDYSLLAGRLAVTGLHKTTPSDLLEVATTLYNYVNPKNGQPSALISQEVFDVVTKYHERLQKCIDYSKDLNYEYFGFKTLERSYLLRVERQKARVVAERPQQMLMRVAIGIHGHDIERVEETYKLLSDGLFTHATPTLFNSGTPNPQMSSCFLIKTKEDSIAGIFDTLKTCALISKCAGGIGVNVHNVRCTGSYIRGTNGTSNGLVPMLRVFNDTARYVDQGGGKRKGSFAMYLEPWHGDIFDFLQLRKNTGKEEVRARDLFYALWIPDLFMKRVEQNAKWTLFDPNVAKGLADVWGKEFEELYEKYEREGKGVRSVQAHELWFSIIEAQIETGTPYMLYKDACNAKSNQQHLGTIRCSNLCTEIIEYTSEDEVAVCNLASIALPKFVNVAADGTASFDHERLVAVTRVITRNLNNVIDRNYYPVEEARNSNMRHRPIGIGVQGLADTFCKLEMAFASPEARTLNRDIFESIYYGAVTASCALAKEQGRFPSWEGCPMSKGQLQFDMWGVEPKSGRYDWATVRKEVMEHGVRNSLLMAPMPTASTSQILGNNECFEPFTSNIYLRRVLSGEFPVINKFLVRDLIKRDLWNESTRNQIIAHNGSVQQVSGMPRDMQERYRTVWEIKQKDLIDMAADRAAYIDQSQSLNLFLESPSTGQLTSMHFYTWKRGLKTGMYYLRSRPAADAIKFTVDQAKLGKAAAPAGGAKQEPEECIACGS